MRTSRRVPVLLASHFWCAAVVVLSAAPTVTAQTPALGTPSALPSDSAAYGELGLQIAVLLQVRADFPEAEGEISTFFLRKAEVGLRAHVNEHTHVSVELDPVDPDDPFRRTYLRLSHLPRLHVKFERSDDVRQDEMRLLTLGLGAFLDGDRSKLQASYLADLRSGFGEGGFRIQFQVEF